MSLYPKRFNSTPPNVLPSHFLHILLPFLSILFSYYFSYLFYFIVIIIGNHTNTTSCLLQEPAPLFVAPWLPGTQLQVAMQGIVFIQRQGPQFWFIFFQVFIIFVVLLVDFSPPMGKLFLTILEPAKQQARKFPLCPKNKVPNIYRSMCFVLPLLKHHQKHQKFWPTTIKHVSFTTTLILFLILWCYFCW